MTSLYRDGFIYKASTDDKFESACHVKLGEHASIFSEVELSDLSSLISNIIEPASIDISGWSLHSTEPASVHASFAMSPEWVTHNQPTLAIECEPHPAAFKLTARTLTGSLRYRVRTGTSYVLSAFTACHRCTANLEWNCYDQDGKHILSHSLRLPLARKATDCERVTLPITVPDHAYEADVSVTYDAAQEPVEGFNSFIFLTDLRLEPKYGLSKQDFASILLGTSKTTDAANAKVYRASLDVEWLSTFGGDIKIENIRDESSETIEHGSWLRHGHGRGATIEHLDVTKLKFTGVTSGLYTVFFDNVRLGLHDLFPIDKNGQNFEISTRLCDGEYHKVELRDVTGCYRYCQCFILLPHQQTPWQILQEHSGAPPEYLSPVAGQRYKSLLAHLRHHASGEDTAFLHQIEHVHSVLMKGFHHNKKFTKLRFEAHAEPRVSIVIPVHNKFEVTYFCLCALLFAYVETTFEVVLVDDGSTDRTVEIGDLTKNVVCVRNAVGSGFVRACNKGAEVARGEFVVLLNNDTEPAYRWLDELVSSFDIFEGVGLAGSKLVYPDGRLQEAGGIVWKSGNPWNYGRCENTFDPRYSYTRDVDYVSGAAVMLPIALWREVGGFSDEFAPAYFEDTDLAFKVRAAGRRTILVAPSVVYHFEGVSSGTDVSSGVKRHQEINRPRFKRKWRHVFQSHGEEGYKPDLEKDRGIVGRALFLDYATPRADMDAGSYAAIEEMRLFQRLGYKVTFFPQNAAYLGDYSTSLQRRGIEVLHAPFHNWIGDVLKKRGAEFNVIYITRYYVAKDALDLVRRYAPQAKVLFCNADLHFLRLLRSASAQNDETKLAEAVRVREEELAVMRRVDAVLSYNDVEHAVILSHNLLSTRVMKLPWIERIHDVHRNFDQRDGISFLGGFNHYPNAEAVRYFISEVMPSATKSIPDLTFHVFGSNMPKDLSDLATPHVVMHGFTEDLEEVFGDCRIFVAPLLSGAGIKGKVLAALAWGIPCVLTPTAAEGIGLRHGYDCLIAETPAQWGSALESLYRDPKLWRTLADNAQALIAENFSEARGLKMMRTILETMDLPMKQDM